MKQPDISKPLTIRRRDFIENICTAINGSELPAFVVVSVLEDVLSRVRPGMDAELKRDTAAYRAALLKANQEKTETTDQKEGE